MLTGAHTEQSSLSNFLSLLKPKYTHSELTAYGLEKVWSYKVHVLSYTEAMYHPLWTGWKSIRHRSP